MPQKIFTSPHLILFVTRPRVDRSIQIRKTKLASENFYVMTEQESLLELPKLAEFDFC
jgi:hypothetical protein